MKSKIYGINTLVKTKFVSLYDVVYKNKVGKENHWMVASRKNEKDLKEIYLENKEDNVDAVVVVSYHKKYQKLVLVKQFRVPINKFVYELPAGLVDNNEDVIDSVKRELKEETGLEVLEINQNFEKLYLSPGMTDESVSLVFCTCDGELSDENLEDDEEIIPVLVSQDEAKKLLENKEVMDIKALLVLKSFVSMGSRYFID
ncbi:MAG: NUDIX hydrolase [Peptostreptococcaceae bacterium]